MAPLLLPTLVMGQTVADLALAAAFRDHLRFSAGFRQKFRTGYFSVPADANDEQLIASALDRLRERLAALSMDSVALVHHLDGQRHLRAWLISSDGVIASSRTPEPYRTLDYLRPALNINARMEMRAAVPRSGIGIDMSDASEQGFETMVPDQALAFTARQLLGGAIGEELAKLSGRLMILPVLDSGTAPYPGLPLPDGSRLVEKFATLIVPDLHALLNPSMIYRAKDLRPDRAVVFGDPDLSNDPEYRFAPLPGARREAEKIAELLGMPERQAKYGRDATLDSFLRLAGKSGVQFIHLASHGISNQVNPMDGSFVGLSDRRLSGQVLRGNTFEMWGIDHPIVILSGCQTALGKIFDGGAYGLSRAFFSAGAAQIVSSLWNVDDNATEMLMTDLVDRMQLTYPLEYALQRAQQTVAQQYGDDFGAWASFCVFGLPSER